MLFNSLQFLIFFPVVTIIYFLLPHRLRWLLLLVASCVFYMAFVPIYILILLLTIVVDYFAGIWIENAEGKRKKWFLVLSIVANVGVLAFFKYYNFFVFNIDGLFHFLNVTASIPVLKILLPIGLSFHTFQAMSYTIEVYRGNQKAERHPGIYALYVMFYPQLVAGPIERPQNMLHQFHEHHHFDFDRCCEGLKLMTWGLFKKIVIADRLAIVVNNIYNHAPGRSGPELVLATLFFTFQLYCDFSAYSDIALGSAQVMGFTLMVNFDRPFAAKSITEFWRKWHISLSSWFYDYIFNPLVLLWRNSGKTAIVAGLLVTFFLSGFWHGAGWKFVIYGLLNGIALVYEYFTKKQRKKLFGRLPLWLNHSLSKVLTVGFVGFTWIFFRANSIRDALYIIGHLFSGWKKVFSLGGIKAIMTTAGGSDTVAGIYNVAFGMVLIVLLEYLQGATREKRVTAITENRSVFRRWGFYYALIVAILLAGAFNQQEFIYFQF